MKKILAFILFALYFTSSSGATIHIHYCMNELAGFSLTDADESDGLCDYCGMDKSKWLKHTGKPVSDCCNEHKLVLKTDRDHRSGFSPLECSSFQTELISLVNFTFTCFSFPPATTKQDYKKGPPPLSPTGIYILNRSFRI